MNPSGEDKIAPLRAAVSKAQQDKARAELELDAARKREQAALKVLSDEFGVSSLEEAGQLLQRYQADLDQACAEAEAALKETGSQEQ